MAKVGTEKTYTVDLSKVVFPANYDEESREALKTYQAQVVIQKGVSIEEVEKAYPIKEFNVFKLCSEAIDRALQEYSEAVYLSPQRRKVIVPANIRKIEGHITVKKSHGTPFHLETDEMQYLIKMLKSDVLTGYKPYTYLLDYLEQVAGGDFNEKE